MLKLTALDEHLLAQVPIEYAVILERAGPWIIIRTPNDRRDIVNLSEILQIVIRGRNLDDLIDDFADSGPHNIESRDKLKGGKIAQRDNDFGIDDDVFWDWWHICEKKYHGKNINSKEEADDWYRIYKDLQLMIKNSIFYVHISSLTPGEMRVAMMLMLELAFEIYMREH